MQLPQLRARLDAELAGQDAAGVGERGQRLGLALAAVQREHQLGAEPLPQRMRAHQLNQLLRGLGVAAEREDDVDVLFGRGQPLLVKSGPDDLRQGPAIPASAAPCHNPSAASNEPAAPARSPAARARGPRPAARRTPRRQAGRVPASAGTRFGGQQHPARCPVRPPRLERCPQPGHVDMQRVDRAGGQLLAPDPVDELIPWNHLVRPHRQEPSTARRCGAPRSSSASPRQARTGPSKATRNGCPSSAVTLVTCQPNGTTCIRAQTLETDPSPAPRRAGGAAFSANVKRAARGGEDSCLLCRQAESNRSSVGLFKQMKDTKDMVNAAPGMVAQAQQMAAQAQQMAAAQQAATQAQMAQYGGAQPAPSASRRALGQQAGRSAPISSPSPALRWTSSPR